MARAVYGGSESFFLSDSGHFERFHNYQLEFRQHLLAEPGLAGRVLDIGCGPDLPSCLQDVALRCGELHGVDPDPAVMRHPHLKKRWQGEFEKVALSDHAYDLAYAFNVVEHIPDPMAFFKTVRRILKPGGVFWALTPHNRHPFCWLARAVELAGGKRAMHERDPGVNAYSSYYRLNSRRKVLKTIGDLGFRTARFHYFPAGWSQYFPRPLQPLAKCYDWARAYRKPSAMLILAYRLEAESG